MTAPVVVAIVLGLPVVAFIVGCVMDELDGRPAPGRPCVLCAGVSRAVMRRMSPCPQCGRTFR